jgi:hypothetical protein
MMHKLIPDYDKSRWGVGPWNNEPDRFDFTHADFPCFILRNCIGNWCGYVGVPPGHKYYSVSYEELPDMNVHGGLTYSGQCDPPICHDGNEAVWWFGFDTAHFKDLSPGYTFDKGTYRTMQYTVEETKCLAEQLEYLNDRTE